MRNFEERKNEILRRSHERINKRKVVKRYVLGITIPLFICAVSLSVLLYTANFGKKSSVEDVAKPESGEDFLYADDAFNLYTVELNVSDNNGTLKNYIADNDNDRIIKITNILDLAFLSTPEVGTGTNASESSSAATTAPENNDTPIKEENKSPSIKYTIEVIDSYGESVIFTLEDYKLTNTVTGEVVTLNNAERDSLLYNFGFEEEK